jgi:hypothetical protein
MLRGLLALVVVVVGIACWPRTARANDVIRDGDAFQVDPRRRARASSRRWS